jgi:hypothetical protein
MHMDDDRLRISPNIFMGILSLFVSFVAYTISSSSLGKRSISHTWLFSGLLVINPSEESLNKVAPLSPSSSTSSKRKNTSIRDVSGLQLTCKSILPGAIPLSVMTEKTRPAFLQWQALDAAICVWLASLLALASPTLLAMYTVYQEHTICCDDLKCWLYWWRDQLGGPGLVFVSEPPPHSMIVFLAGLSLWFWWRLVMHATRLPPGNLFMFSPFSYINGWMTFLTVLFMLHFNTGENSISTVQQTLLGIPLNAALEEWSTRVTLWVGLTGFYTPDLETSRLRVLTNVFQLTHLLSAFAASLLAFAVADPCRETMRLYWGNILGDEVVIIGSSKEKLFRWLKRKQHQAAVLVVGVLPIVCWSTYLFQREPFFQISPRTCRTLMAWCFIWNMASLTRSLTQTYLLQALCAADRVLDSTKKPSPADVLFPFQVRNQRLLNTGSQLLVFPAMVLIVVTLAHGAGRLPVAVSDTANTITTGIFPFAFHQSLWTQQQEEEYQTWEAFQVKASAQSAVDDTSILAELLTTRANIDLCDDNVSFSFVRLQNNVTTSEGHSNQDDNEYAAPVLKVIRASDLTSNNAVSKTTFVQVLRSLQRLAKKARVMSSDFDSTSSETGYNVKAIKATEQSEFDEEQRQSHQAFHNLVQALLFHPLLTSTIILPVLDFFGFILSSLWILYFVYYGALAWYRRSTRRRYVLKMKGDSCRIMSLHK